VVRMRQRAFRAGGASSKLLSSLFNYEMIT
jgi:hypothetical protein